MISSERTDTLDRHAALIRQLQGAFRRGDGDPEGVVEAPPGTLFLSTDGVVYIKETGTGSTGWAEIVTSTSFAFFLGP